MLDFRPLTDYHPGILDRLLTESYQGLREDAGAKWDHAREGWRQCDALAFACPTTVGACCVITRWAGEPIGFASWDPRRFPTGVIGHNVILPAYRGHGYGRRQLAEILHRFTIAGFTTVEVTTDASPFFIPAQRMYLANGFREVSREPGGIIPGSDLIRYTVTLPAGEQ